jgi:serine/threonine protein kinase
VFIGDAFASELKVYGNALVIKVTKIGKNDERSQKLFKQEVSIMHLFRNERNIAKLLGWNDDPYTILMKYYPLGALDGFLESNLVSKRILLSFMHDIANGIQTMHTAGFVHRDLKPENVLVDQDKHGLFCCLSDFGITQIIDPSSLLVKDFSVVNIKGFSMAFVSPEVLKQVRYGQQEVSDSRKGDVYSYAIILKQLLCRGKAW